MPSERKRPSFTPQESTSTSAEGSTGWVYRSDGTGDDQRPALLRWAGTAERKTSNFAGALIEKTSVPFEIVFLGTLPLTRYLLWPFGGKWRRQETPPAA